MLTIVASRSFLNIGILLLSHGLQVFSEDLESLTDDEVHSGHDNCINDESSQHWRHDRWHTQSSLVSIYNPHIGNDSAATHRANDNTRDSTNHRLPQLPAFSSLGTGPATSGPCTSSIAWPPLAASSNGSISGMYQTTLSLVSSTSIFPPSLPVCSNR